MIAVALLLAACARHAAPAPAPAPVATPAPVVTPAAPPNTSPNVSPNVFASTPAVYIPDVSNAGRPLPDGFLAWDATLKGQDVTEGQETTSFVFAFTNVSPGKVTILEVRPSCGCTTAELPPVPWTLDPGQSGLIRLNVKIHGTVGTLFKSVAVRTDQGMKSLTLRINLLPAPAVKMTDDELQQGIQAARVDRQAVFRGQCASCHNKDLAGKYDHELFQAACAICHEAEHRATMVPDLRALTVPTNEEFWRTWIAAGKPGSLMPAFSNLQGGPLNDLQIASLARYLNLANPSKAPLPPSK